MTQLNPQLTTKSLRDQGLVLAVQHRGGECLSRCYNATYWTVFSTRPLNEASIEALIQHSQEFSITGITLEDGYYITQVREATDSSG